MKPQYIYNAILKRVIDGDSIVVDLDKGFDDWKIDYPVRLAHMDAKERWQIGGKEATAHLLSLLPRKSLVLKTYKPADKFGRYLAEVYCDDVYINQQMIDDGFATPYEGGGR